MLRLRGAGGQGRPLACILTWAAKRVGWRLPGVGSESRAVGTDAFRRLRGTSTVDRMLFLLPQAAAKSACSRRSPFPTSPVSLPKVGVAELNEGK